MTGRPVMRSEGLLEGGMSSLRAAFLKERLGIDDPHAAMFLSEAARRYAQATFLAHPGTVGRALARFDHFSKRMARAAETIQQFLMLGVGLDTRGLWLPEILASGTRVIEVDLPSAIERKLEILAGKGVTYPDRVVAIGMDIGSPDLPRALRDAGLDATKPVAVFAEGVTFQLPRETTRRILDPRYLGLAKGSAFTFDYWTNERVDERNARGSTSHMHHFPYAVDPAALRESLVGIGYERVSVQPLSELASRLWPEEPPTAPDWYVVDATVGAVG